MLDVAEIYTGRLQFVSFLLELRVVTPSLFLFSIRPVRVVSSQLLISFGLRDLELPQQPADLFLLALFEIRFSLLFSV